MNQRMSGSVASSGDGSQSSLGAAFSFQYSQIDNRLRGYVFVFDEADGLVFVKKGYLAEIADELRRRSVFDVERAQEMLRREAN